MSYFNHINKSLSPNQRTDLKIIEVNFETGEVIEKDNPDAVPFEYISPEREIEIFNQLAKGYTIGVNDDYTLKMIPPDPIEMQKSEAVKRIAELKAYLFKTDYQAIKFAEGALSAEDYADMKAKRANWRKEINDLEAILNE